MNNIKNCIVYNIKIDKDEYKKRKNFLQELLQKKETKENFFVWEKDAKDLSTSNKQINDNRASVSPYNNHRHVIIGPSDVGKLITCWKFF